jgi:hypothetical protein
MDLVGIADTPEEAVKLVLAGFEEDERRGGMFGSAEEEWADADETGWYGRPEQPGTADGE